MTAEHAHGIDTGGEVAAESAAQIGRAVCRGYCYACPTPIEIGDLWRRERVGNTVPHSFRLVHHPECPTRVPAFRDLCGDRDLERYDSHDYCTAHDVSVPTDGICPVTLGILTATRASAADAVLAEARRLCCGENPSAHHAASAKHSERMAFAGDLARAVRGA